MKDVFGVVSRHATQRALHGLVVSSTRIESFGLVFRKQQNITCSVTTATACKWASTKVATP